MKKMNAIILMLVAPLMFSCGDQAVEEKKESSSIYTDFEYLDENSHVKYCKNCDEDDPNYKIVESHTFDNGVVTIAPTHVSEGLKIYTCTECGFEKNESIARITTHTFNRKVLSEDFIVNPATCSSQAEYYYSCECGEHGEETFFAGPKLSHKIQSVSIVSDTSKKNYSAYEIFDPTGLKVQYTCKDCGEHIADLEEISFTYENGVSFKCGDTKIVGHLQDKSFELNGFNVVKANNYITGVEDLKIKCHQQIDLSKISSAYGKVDVVVKDKDGSTLTPEELESLEESKSPYVLTAKVEAGDDFESVTMTSEIVVEHEVKYRSSKKSTCCSCGYALLSNYFFNAKTNQVDISHLEGEYKDRFNPDTCKILDSATGKEVKWADIKTGLDQDLITTIDGETFHFAGIKVDKILTTIQEIQETCQFTEEIFNGGTPLGTDYCVVACDIDCQNYVYEGGYFTWDSSAYNQNGTCFRGTLDGRNHSIYNLSLGGKGIFSFLGADGVCKDIKFEHINPVSTNNVCCVTYYAYYCVFSNIKFQLDSYPELGNTALSGNTSAYKLSDGGNIVAMRAEGNTGKGTFVNFDNILIDASGFDIGSIVCGFTSNNSEQPKFLNYVVKCKSFVRVGMYYDSDYQSTGKFPEGISVYIVE